MEKAEPDPDSALAVLRAEIVRPGSLAMIFMGTALSLVTVFVLPERKMPAAWLAVTVILFLAYIWLSTVGIRNSLARERYLRTAYDQAATAGGTRLPKVMTAMQGVGDELTLLLEPNALFGQSMLVSIYHGNQNGFEVLVGQGVVGNIQSNGSIQISIRSWEQAYDSLRRSVVSQDLSVISKLLVRPSSSTESIPANLEAMIRGLRLGYQDRNINNG